MPILGVETQRQWSDLAIMTAPPRRCLACFSLVTSLGARPRSRNTADACDRRLVSTKRHCTFSDAIAAGTSQKIWHHQVFFHVPVSPGQHSNSPPAMGPCRKTPLAYAA